MKIFCGEDIYEVQSRKEAFSVMKDIASTAGGLENLRWDKGFYVDIRNPIPLGDDRFLYNVRGLRDDNWYAKTDSKDLLEEQYNG